MDLVQHRVRGSGYRGVSERGQINRYSVKATDYCLTCKLTPPSDRSWNGDPGAVVIAGSGRESSAWRSSIAAWLPGICCSRRAFLCRMSLTWARAGWALH